MKYYDWNDEKNELLKRLRGVSFEQVVLAIASGDLIDRLKHPNPEKYSNSRSRVVRHLNHWQKKKVAVTDRHRLGLQSVFMV
jgi:uncharacterized DUF497 family protein